MCVQQYTSQPMLSQTQAKYASFCAAAIHEMYVYVFV